MADFSLIPVDAAVMSKTLMTDEPWDPMYVDGMPQMLSAAIRPCLFIGWILKPKAIVDEVEEAGRSFKAKALYAVMVKYFAPALVIAILVSEVCRALGIGGWKI